MGKLLVLSAAAYVLYTLLRGESLRRALWPIAWCALGYVVIRYGLVSAARARVFIGVAFLLAPWIIAPYLPRIRAWRDRRAKAAQGGAPPPRV